MRESPRPFIFLGYVVTKPHEGNYHILIDEANMYDIEPGDYDRWCEYIAFRGVNRVGYARISRGTITDTEVALKQMAISDGRYKQGSLLSKITLYQFRVIIGYQRRLFLENGDFQTCSTGKVSLSLNHTFNNRCSRSSLPCVQ